MAQPSRADDLVSTFDALPGSFPQRSTVELLLDSIEAKLPPQYLQLWRMYRLQYGAILLAAEKQYLDSNIYQRLLQTTGVNSELLLAAGACALVLLFFAAFQKLASLALTITGFVYPAYKSLNALEEENPSEHRQWLTYWSVYASLGMTEYFLRTPLRWIPMFYWAKLALLIWSAHPATRGAEVLYQNIFRPLFLRYRASVENKIRQIQFAYSQLLSRTLTNHDDKRN